MTAPKTSKKPKTTPATKKPAAKAKAAKAPAKKTAKPTEKPQQEKAPFRFPKGNRWWECRAKHGRDGIWTNPEDLLKDCLGYFAWLEANPFLDDQRVVIKNTLKSYNKTRMRPATIHGLRLYLGIGKTTWHEYKNKRGADFTNVCTYVEDAIYEQKFTGAAAGFLNAVIIARDLGLKDSISAEVTGEGGGPVQITYKGVKSDGRRSRD